MTTVKVGDVVLLPVGTGRKLFSPNGELLVVEVYPSGWRIDHCRRNLSERPRVFDAIQLVALPVCDPVYGKLGPLIKCWT